MATRTSSDPTTVGPTGQRASAFTNSAGALSMFSLETNSANNMFSSSHAGDGTFSASNELEEFVGNKIEIMKRTQTAFNRAAILAGFVPDYIVKDDKLEVPYLRKFEAVVFMTDISGFTALTEAYSLNGKGGTEQLTKTLANYMGPLAECILRTDGDIIKFAGDAFLSVWKVSGSDSDYSELLQKVIDCALYCQEKYGSYVTDVQITIKVKIGIGAGICYAGGLGNNYFHHYCVYGPGVSAASSAEHQCVSGDVILHESAWKYLNPKHYTYTPCEEDGFFKVTDILHFINPSKRGRPIVAQRLNMKAGKKAGIAHNLPDIVRPILEQTISGAAEDRLRKYVIPPVLKKLDDDMPLDYLNESRMVSIVFMHVDYEAFELNAKYGQNIVEVVQSCFLTILKAATNLNGCLTKVIMFDKGLTYLVVFGLPGYIQDNQTANSLNFAHHMKTVLSAIPSVKEVSIGCTSGSTYCGILGHPRRHEYTVIGKQVNKAARLMIYYPGKVTCSQDCYYGSKLPPSYFQQLESKALKGISNVGKIYEYLSAESANSSAIKKYDYPLLGRRLEREMIINNLRVSRQEFDKSFTTSQMVQDQSTFVARSLSDQVSVSSCSWMIVIEGENGIGKSRFLSTCMNDAEKLEWKIFSVILSMQHAALYLYPVETLALQILGMEGLRSAQEREEHVRKLAAQSGDAEIISGISALNEVLHLKLSTPAKFAFVDANARHVYAQHMLVQLIKTCYPRTMILLCVEDAHYMSKQSWEYINYISRLSSVSILMTLRRNPDGRPRIPDIAYKICYHSPHVTTIRLQGLQNQYILPLACQILEVKGIPTELEKMIIAKSQGNPTWVEDVLNEMLSQDKIKIVELPKGSKVPKDVKISMVAERYLRKETLKITKKVPLVNSDYIFLDSDAGSDVGTVDTKTGPKQERQPDLRICLIKSNTNLHTTAVSGSLKEKLLDTFDALNTNDQMLVKCACVLGSRFSHIMLNRLLPLYGRDAKKYLTSFRNLMEEKIFSCASQSERNSSGSTRSTNKNVPVACYCNQSESVSDNFADDYEVDLTNLHLPNYCYCKYTEFSRESMVEVIYELLTEDLKKELHLKAAKYLETTAIQCVSCGGPQTTYLYGFVLKASTEEEEEGIAAAAGLRNRRQAKRLSADSSRRSLQASLKIKKQFSEADAKKLDNQDAENDNLDIQAIKTPDLKKNSNARDKVKSLTAELTRLSKGMEEGGGQLASVELEILNTLLEYENQKNAKKGWCCRRAEKIDGDLGADEEQQSPSIAAGSNSGKDGTSMEKSLRSKSNSTNRITSTGSVSGTIDTADSDDNSDILVGDSIEEYDLRGCQCTAIQTRLCVELVKHYRKADKLGKCLFYLLEAAESSITIGNTTQALNYVDEASDLLDEIRKKDFVPSEDVDDTIIIEKDVNRQMAFLYGLCYYEMGAYSKAKDALLKSLTLMGMALPDENNKRSINVAIQSAQIKIWQIYHTPSCCATTDKAMKKGNKMAELASMKIRALSYLEKMYKDDNNTKMGLLAALWQVVLAEKLGDIFEDVIPAYSNMMEMWTWLGKHDKAGFFEDKALSVVRDKGFEDRLDAIGLLTIANLFFALSNDRLRRGQFKPSTEAGYLALRISNMLHDSTLSIHIFPSLVQSLMFTLQLSELIEALHNLWYMSQAEDHWTGTATYFSLVMDLILELCCPLESFYYCEQFVTGKDWNEDVALFREFEIQFSFESSLALWYARFYKWDEAFTWRSQAEMHKPKAVTLLGVAGSLKLLECYLISANFHQSKKRYQLFANDREIAKKLLKDLKKWVQILPVFLPRYYHMLAYYAKIRDRKRETEYNLNQACKIARQQGNRLEEEFVKHSRIVWAEMANPTIKYFWLEHTEKNIVDWHSGGEIPWANIMYSLPAPAWS